MIELYSYHNKKKDNMKQLVTIVLLIAVLGIVTHRFQVNAETCVVKNGKVCLRAIPRIVF